MPQTILEAPQRGFLPSNVNLSNIFLNKTFLCFLCFGIQKVVCICLAQISTCVNDVCSMWKYLYLKKQCTCLKYISYSFSHIFRYENQTSLFFKQHPSRETWDFYMNVGTLLAQSSWIVLVIKSRISVYFLNYFILIYKSNHRTFHCTRICDAVNIWECIIYSSYLKIRFSTESVS